MTATLVKEFAPDPEDALLKVHSLNRLCNVDAPPEREWIVEGVLGRGSLSFLCGKPGVGKSALAKTLIGAHLRGNPWLNFSVTQTTGLIIWLGFEEDAFSMREPFRRMGFSDTETRQIAVIDRTGTGGWSTGHLVLALKRLEKMMKDLSPSFLVIDPLLNLTRPKDSNQYEAVKEALDPVLHMARTTGTHIMCLVHAKKGDYNDIEAVLGSIGFAAAPDKIMLHMRRGKRSFLSNPKTRDTWGTSFDELELIFDPTQYTVSVGAQVLSDTQSKTEQRILATLTTPTKYKDLFPRIKGGKEIFNTAFNRLKDDGLITRIGVNWCVSPTAETEGRKSILRKENSPSVSDDTLGSTPSVGGMPVGEKVKGQGTDCAPLQGCVPGGQASTEATSFSSTDQARSRVRFGLPSDEAMARAETEMRKGRVDRLKQQLESAVLGRVVYDEEVD